MISTFALVFSALGIALLLELAAAVTSLCRLCSRCLVCGPRMVSCRLTETSLYTSRIGNVWSHGLRTPLRRSQDASDKKLSQRFSITPQINIIDCKACQIPAVAGPIPGWLLRWLGWHHVLLARHAELPGR